MENKAVLERNNKTRLLSPEKVLFQFEVTIETINSSDHPGYSFIITGTNPKTGNTKSCQYQLANKTHHAYLDFYEKLAHDFDLRLPLNRHPKKTIPINYIPYQEILTQNIHPDILYGYGDPAVLRIEGVTPEDAWYYLIATSNDAPNAFPLLRSRNLTDWEFVNFVFPRNQKPIWAAEGELISDYWAPEMHQIGNEFWLYFVARDKNTRELCIGMAKSKSPEGSFTAADEPILRGNIIDPHVFVQEDNTAYFYWKEDNNDVWPGELIELLNIAPQLIQELFPQTSEQITASFMLTIWPWAQLLEPMERFQVIQVFIESITTRYLNFFNQLSNLLPEQQPPVQEQIRRVQHFMKTPMFAQPLSPDGTALVGEKTKILENDLEWEAHLVEGMWVTRQANKYYLFYAGNDFSTDQYGIGVAIGNSPVGPFQKMEKPFLQSTAQWTAPGHPSVTKDPNGNPMLFLHAYFPGEAGYKQFRALLAVKLKFKDEEVIFNN